MIFLLNRGRIIFSSLILYPHLWIISLISSKFGLFSYPIFTVHLDTLA
ncbi:MAG: hypothetical protein WCG25_08215 [bacterium]